MRYMDRAQAIYAIPNLTCAEQAILLALSDHAADKTHQCWPSLSTIAKLARVSRRTVMTALTVLEHAGYLIRERRAINKTLSDTTRYTVLPRLISVGGRATTALGGRAVVARRTNYPTRRKSHTTDASLAYLATIGPDCSFCGTRKAVKEGLCWPCLNNPRRRSTSNNPAS